MMLSQVYQLHSPCQKMAQQVKSWRIPVLMLSSLRNLIVLKMKKEENGIYIIGLLGVRFKKITTMLRPIIMLVLVVLTTILTELMAHWVFMNMDLHIFISLYSVMILIIVRVLAGLSSIQPKVDLVYFWLNQILIIRLYLLMLLS